MEVPSTLENVKRKISESKNNRSEVLSVSELTAVFLICGILFFAGYADTKNNISQQELEDGTLFYCCYISENSTLSEIRASSCGCKLAASLLYLRRRKWLQMVMKAVKKTR